LIQRYDDYNRWYAMKTRLMHAPQDVAQHLISSGDALCDRSAATPWCSGGSIGIDVNSDAGWSLSTAAVLTVPLDIAFNFSVGDIVTVNGAALSYTGTVGIVANTSVTLVPGRCAGISAGNIESVTIHKQSTNSSARVDAVRTSGTEFIVDFKPMVSVLQLNLPLFLMKGGIEVQFELELGYRGIKSGLTYADSITAPDYEISTPRFFGMLATPHPDIVDMYLQEWRSADGLQYAIPSVRCRRVNGSATTETNNNIQMNVGVRSARRVYTMVGDSIIGENNAQAAWCNNSISDAYRSNISQFQYKIGSHEFPNRAVACDTYSTELYEQLKQISGNRHFRFPSSEWNSNRSLIQISSTTAVTDSKAFIMGADLSRDNGRGSGLTGSDLSIVPIDLEIARSAAYNADGLPGLPVYRTFIEHDAYLKLSSEEMAVSN
jgi:hypothetical protein